MKRFGVAALLIHACVFLPGIWRYALDQNGGYTHPFLSPNNAVAARQCASPSFVFIRSLLASVRLCGCIFTEKIYRSTFTLVKGTQK